MGMRNGHQVIFLRLKSCFSLIKNLNFFKFFPSKLTFFLSKLPIKDSVCGNTVIRSNYREVPGTCHIISWNSSVISWNKAVHWDILWFRYFEKRCMEKIHLFGNIYNVNRDFPGGPVVKNPPANAGGVRGVVWSLGWEDPLEEGMATHSSILACRIPIVRGAWQAIVHWVTKSWTWLSWLSMHTQC